jgi:hypothetical protein
MTTSPGQDQPITRNVLLDVHLGQAKDTHRVQVRHRRAGCPRTGATDCDRRRRSVAGSRVAGHYIDLLPYAWYKESARALSPPSQVTMG